MRIETQKLPASFVWMVVSILNKLVGQKRDIGKQKPLLGLRRRMQVKYQCIDWCMTVLELLHRTL